MEEQAITLTFEFTGGEYRRALWQLARNGRGGRRTLFGWLLVILLGIALYVVIQRGNQPTPSPISPVAPSAHGTSPPSTDFITEILVPLLPWLIVFLFVWFFLFRLLRKKGTAQQQRTYTFRSDGVSVILPYQRVEMEWAVFQRFVENKYFFLLMTAPRIGHVIPKRGFADVNEMDRFREMLRHHINVPTARQAFPVLPAAPPPLPPVGKV